MKLWWELSKRWLKQHRWLSLSAILLAALTVFAGVGLLGVAGWFLTSAFIVGTLATFNVFIPSALVRGLSLLRIVSRYVERVVGHHVTLGLQSALRSESFARIARLEPGQLAQFRDGDLVARLISDIDRLDTFFLLLIAPIAAGSLAGLFFSWVLGQFLPFFAWVVLLGVAVAIVVLPFWLARWTAVTGQSVQEDFAVLRAIAHDSFVAHSDLAVFQAYSRVLNEFETVLSKNAIAADKLNAGASLGALLQQLLMGLLIFLLFILGGIAFNEEQLSAAVWVGFIFGLFGLFEVFAPIMRGASQLGAIRAASKRLHALDGDLKIASQAQKRSILALPEEPLNLSVRNLKLRYNQHWVLKDLSFNLQAGQHMVIHGLSGSGKTTLLQCLMQMLSYEGKICYGDKNLAKVQKQGVFRHFAYLSQHSPVFLGTVRENLKIGDPQASDEQMWDALQAVQLASHIRKTGGLSSWLGEGGNRLSVGQNRRLCVARILLYPAHFWLLDEPTAGLDEPTAQALMRDIQKLAKNRSLIVVSHAKMPEDFAHTQYELVAGVLRKKTSK